MQIRIGTTEFSVRSCFSKTGGGFATLGTFGESRSDEIWPATVTEESKTTYKIQARNHGYQLDRRIEILPNHVRVRDTLTNLTESLIGIRYAHEIYAPDGYSGRMNGNSLTPPCQLDAPEIPIVQVIRGENSLGMVARDNVFRNHSICYGTDQAWGIKDEGFGLPAHGSYTTQWELYPVESADHYRFINTVRRVWGTAQAHIPGLFAFVFPQWQWVANGKRLDEMSVEELRQWLAITRIHTLCFIVEAEDGAPGVAEGRNHGKIAPWPWAQIEAFGEDYLKANTSKAYWRPIIARLREAKPELKILPYFHNGANPLNTDFTDARVLLDNEQQRIFKNFMDITRYYYYATPSNGFGKLMRKVFHATVSEFGQDGLYWDEYSYGNRMVNMSGVPDWDGHTVVIDPATNEIVRKATNLALITQPLRTAFNRELLRDGKVLWTNWQPSTEEDTALNVPHFLEYVRADDWARGHLASPLGCGGSSATSNADVMKEVWRYLQYGLLYVHVGKGAYAETTPGILGEIYPITPTELHAGYILGKERIITSRSGRFGFGDASTLEVVTYDRSGLRKTGDVRVATDKGKRFCLLTLEEGEIAMITRATRAADPESPASRWNDSWGERRRIQ